MTFILVAVLVLLFGFVILFGAPYLPTRKQQSEVALDMLALKPGQTLYELGCGDGRVLRLAAQRGLNVVGYELNPILVVIAKIWTWKYRSQVKVKLANFWHVDLSEADGVFVFLIDRFMPRLDAKAQKEFKGKLVSYAFEIPGKKHSKEAQGMFLYKY